MLQHPLIMNAGQLNSITSKCDTATTDYDKLRISGQSLGLTHTIIHPKGEISLYILVNNHPETPEGSSPLEILHDNRVLAAGTGN